MANRPRRPRGRPKGTGKDDSAALNRIADLLVGNPSLKPTTAIRRIGVHNESDTRRLQVKWKASGAALLAAARVRKDEAKEARPPAAPPSDMFAAISAIAARTEEIRRALEGPAAEFLRQQKMIEDTLGPVHELMQQFEAQQRMIRQALGPAEELRRIQQSLNPWWLRRR
jgi:hypothetical protein